MLQQGVELNSRKRHPCRYENGLWTPSEMRYDAGKLECRGLLRALKKLWYYHYGVRFVLEIDARTLVHQLNQPAVNRWLAWIRMFDFELKHVSGTKHGCPDVLSRRPRVGLALGLKGSAHGLAIGISCTRVLNQRKYKKKEGW